MNFRCPFCHALYRLDPARLPADRVRARCARCRGTFPLGRTGPLPAPATGAGGAAPPGSAREPTGADEPAAETPAVAVATRGTPPAGGEAPAGAQPGPAGAAAPVAAAATEPGTSTFSERERLRARRVARALVSDMVVYHPERRERGLENGTLEEEFREEIEKSWNEYVAQVGAELAQATPYWREALNEILGGGARLF